MPTSTHKDVSLVLRLIYRACRALAILTLIFPLTAIAGDIDPAQFRKQIEETTITQVIDPQTVIGQNGTVYRLAGIDLPGLYAADLPPWITDARKSLEAMVKGKMVRIYVAKSPDNRTNRLEQTLAHLTTRTDGRWVQGALLEQGYARAYPTETSPEMAKEMYAAEAKAIQENVGLWAIPENRPRDAGSAAALIGGVGIIQGKIVSVSQAQSLLYLNFGQDWKNDATIGLSSRLRQGLARKGIDPRAWAGKTVMVRGFVEPYYGPFINLTTPAQLTLLEDDAPALAKAPQGKEDIPGGLNQYIVTPREEAKAAPPAEKTEEKDEADAKKP